jgi:hypothetical protein
MIAMTSTLCGKLLILILKEMVSAIKQNRQMGNVQNARRSMFLSERGTTTAF